MNKNLLVTLLIISGILIVILVGALLIPPEKLAWTRINITRVKDINQLPANQDQPTKIISVDEAKNSIDQYLENFRNPNLQIKEIIIFDNEAYSQIIEADTGLGAFELIVDPTDLSIYHMQGPNLLWNIKYGYLEGGGIIGSPINTTDYLAQNGTDVRKPLEDLGYYMRISSEERQQIMQINILFNMVIPIFQSMTRRRSFTAITPSIF